MSKINECGQRKIEQIDVMDVIINCLREHEKNLDHLIDKMEHTVIKEINSNEFKLYDTISINDKRVHSSTNYGKIIKSSYGVDGLELSTDRGFIICFSGSPDIEKVNV